MTQDINDKKILFIYAKQSSAFDRAKMDHLSVTIDSLLSNNKMPQPRYYTQSFNMLFSEQIQSYLTQMDGQTKDMTQVQYESMLDAQLQGYIRYLNSDSLSRVRGGIKGNDIKEEQRQMIKEVKTYSTPSMQDMTEKAMRLLLIETKITQSAETISKNVRHMLNARNFSKCFDGVIQVFSKDVDIILYDSIRISVSLIESMVIEYRDSTNRPQGKVFVYPVNEAVAFEKLGQINTGILADSLMMKISEGGRYDLIRLLDKTLESEKIRDADLRYPLHFYR